MDQTDLDVQGYDFCACGEWVLAGQKLCGECALKLADASDDVIALEVDGRPVTMRRPKRKPKANGVGTGDRGLERRARDRARTRAWIRLARIYEPMFAVLYHEEQLREGVDPMPLPPMAENPTDMILRDLSEYAERLRDGWVTETPEPSAPTIAE
jgi:hypothetical protein